MSDPTETPTADGLRLTLIGHATVLIELDGVRILTDPLLSGRLGPLRRAGPVPDPRAIGPVDCVLVSHAHPDHFHPRSLRAVVGRPTVVVPRGLGPTVQAAGRRQHEVVAGDRVTIGPVRVTAVPARHRRWARHPSARPLGYLIEGSSGVYFAGDTALYPAMAGLTGRVDVALLPVGRWGPPHGPSRLDPISAVDAAVLVGARTVIPIHWGTLYLPGFATGRWGWGSFGAGDEFAARSASQAPGIGVRVLRPGDETVVPGTRSLRRPARD